MKFPSLGLRNERYNKDHRSVQSDDSYHTPCEQYCPSSAASNTGSKISAKSKQRGGTGTGSCIFSDEEDGYSTTDSRVFSNSGSGSSESFALDHVDDPVLAQKEQKAVLWSRIMLITVLIIAAAALAATMYIIVSRNEKENFENQFRSYASEVMALSHQNAQTAIDAIDSFGSTITNIAISTNSTWPFVTLLNYPYMADKVAKICKAENIALLPVVVDHQVEEWSNYYDQHAPQVFQEAIDFEGMNTTVTDLMEQSQREIYNINWTTKPFSKPLPPVGTGPFTPMWQIHTLTVSGLVFQNYNMIDMGSSPRIGRAFEVANATRVPSISEVLRTDPEDVTIQYPMAQIMQPLFARVGDSKSNSEVVAALWVMMDWRNFFLNLLPEGADGIYLVIRSTCNGHTFSGQGFTYTYRINGLDAVPLGVGDLHDPSYDYLEKTAPFVNLKYDDDNIQEGKCIGELVISLYPSKDLEDSFYTNNDIYYMIGVLAIFAFTTAVFVLYDLAIRRRQSKVMARVIKQHRIVSNMFPAEFRDRLYESSNKDGDKSPMGLDLEFQGGGGAAPLAELYPSTTIVFADISGFTAWSSQREPIQVFDLLESLYGEFDKIAHKHSVFKVETVGDCYVACAGLPTPRTDHAVLVAKFARDCLARMDGLTQRLEVRLGPDTTDLKLRLGIHSGQVTAGVLKGERSRFQLFGDCVNTAARMEATSCAGQIQVSSTTAEELIKAKREHWIKPRDGAKLSVKGKGEMQTYWLKTKDEAKLAAASARASTRQSSSAQADATATMMITFGENSGHSPDDDSENFHDMDDTQQDAGTGPNTAAIMTKTQRLIEWNFTTLGFLLKQILAARQEMPSSNDLEATKERIIIVEQELMNGQSQDGQSTTVLDEFQEIITLPPTDTAQIANRKDPYSIQLDEKVNNQLRELIARIASMYQPNSFHNFEHASHVTSSVRKLLSRIIKADTSTMVGGSETVQLVDSAGHSFGITSDPLTQFAVVFSAVIHDVDHPGVTNAQLVKENTENCRKYRKSIAEQNSVDLVWSLLMEPQFQDLRSCIYSNEDELRRFRQLVVNTVMATDIADKELGALRKARWATAFNESFRDSILPLDVNRKATIVIEHLIQASDVSHTMQHWHVYKRWNERFFMECYGAYKSGRVDTDPSEGWYKGEIGFFDFYVIPLAMKLDNCGVFGVSSHEYLNYAKANRDEWIIEGEAVVAEFIRKYHDAQKEEAAAVKKVPLQEEEYGIAGVSTDVLV